MASMMAQENPPPVQGTVTLPYETVRLLDRYKETLPPARIEPMSFLQAAHYQVDVSSAPAKITATMRVQHLSPGVAHTTVLPSSVSIDELQPADAPLLVKKEFLQLITQQVGKQELRFRMMPAQADAFVCLPCASATISFVGLPEGEALECEMDGEMQIIRGNRTLGIPAMGAKLSWKKVRVTETEALPPSNWTWRHEVVVAEQEGMLSVRAFSQAETNAGDTLQAELLLPAGVSQILAAGNALDQQSVQRDADGTQRLVLRWKGERQLNREIEVRYQKRVSNVQQEWLLDAPRGPEGAVHATQFYLVDQAQRKFSGAGVSGPFAPQTLTKQLQNGLQGSAYFLIDAPKGQASVQQQVMPVATTADAMITKVRWDTRTELDGATLTTGQLELQYRNGSRLPLRLPEKAVLLSCYVNQLQLAPVIAAPGLLEIPLPHSDKALATITLTISYTERIEKFAPLEGQISLRLPSTPFFINSLQWQITMPTEYTAEVAGNLTRPSANTSAPNLILLEKNLCREETPLAEIFYNRNNKLNR